MGYYFLAINGGRGEGQGIICFLPFHSPSRRITMDIEAMCLDRGDEVEMRSRIFVIGLACIFFSFSFSWGEEN